jgi:hypothetical protein
MHKLNSPNSVDLLVVGGGAAGFFAAVNCAELNPELRILIVEKSSRPLAKVLISGGGRCNLTHACFDPAQLVQHYPRGGAALRGPFTRFQPRDTMAWFESHGVRLKTEPDGRVFPVTDSSQTIVDCLLKAAEQAGVVLRTHCTVQSLTPTGVSDARFQVVLRAADGLQELSARSVLLATGGDRSGMQLAAGLGHCLIPPVPSLFSFTLPDPRTDGLAGVSVPHARLRLLDENGKMPRLAGVEQEGALLVTHWGLSGPAVLRLSAWGARWLHERQYHAGLTVNWLGQPLESVQQKLREHKTASSRYKVDARSPFPDLPFRLWQRLCTAASVRPEQNWADLSKAQLADLANELSAGRYNIQGKGQFKDEFVTCGGVDLDEVDFHTLRSRLVPGLYLAAEILDIDGLTGGFNFQSAWTTAWLAAQALGVAR